MNNELLTISKLFNEKLFRIPDYQRGYAWTSVQLEDYWGDIDQISADGNHYTGVITLEPVHEYKYRSWPEDLWIIESKSFAPYYVVDGQQRLTTTIIIIQCITELMNSAEDILNYTTKLEIQKRFLFDTKDGGISRSYIFGYEKDNPSYEYLKTKIFNEDSASDRKEETVYTNNLLAAKEFFKEKLSIMTKDQVQTIYLKATQKLLFNIFTISDEVEVCVAFETMNNRGKPLSYLELLKNRLIYLSTKIDVDSHEIEALRKIVNESWKTIYHNLGRNKTKALDDDFFLRAHYLLTNVNPGPDVVESEEDAKKQRAVHEAIDHTQYRQLINEIFSLSRIAKEKKNDNFIGSNIAEEINEYSIALQNAVKEWYLIFNPKNSTDDTDHNFWLSKINKLAYDSWYPVLLSVMLATRENDQRTAAFKAIERILFIFQLFTGTYRRDYSPFEVLNAAIKLHLGSISLEEFIAKVRGYADRIVSSEYGVRALKESLRAKNYYSWRSIHYFLYEYNLEIQMRSKTSREKIDWNNFIESKNDYASIEHIYPRRPTAVYWRDRFQDLSSNQRDLLRNAIGNLLPLSKPKNASLSNRPFPEKVSGISQPVGYSFGSYAENEVAIRYENWDPSCILDRSLLLLDFLEMRWNIPLGKDSEKVALLGLGFLPLPHRKSERRYFIQTASKERASHRRATKAKDALEAPD